MKEAKHQTWLKMQTSPFPTTLQSRSVAWEKLEVGVKGVLVGFLPILSSGQRFLTFWIEAEVVPDSIGVEGGNVGEDRKDQRLILL